MKKVLLQHNRSKKGVSLMIGYVLLIVIVIGLSVAVFTYLKLYLPSEKPKCPEDISLLIDPECKVGEIIIKYTNKGLFSVDGTLVRVGNVSRLAKDLLNQNNFAFYNDSGPVPLKPGDTWFQSYDYLYTSDGEVIKELEIEPVLFIDGEAVLCDGAIVKRLIACPATG